MRDTCEGCELFEFKDFGQYKYEGSCGKHGISYPLKRRSWKKGDFAYVHWTPFLERPKWCKGLEAEVKGNIEAAQQALAHVRSWRDSSMKDKTREDQMKYWLHKALDHIEKIVEEFNKEG